MDLSRAAYSRDLKIAAMRALDAGSTTGEIARKYQLSPHLLERWRGEWRATGDPGVSGGWRGGGGCPGPWGRSNAGGGGNDSPPDMGKDVLKKTLTYFNGANHPPISN